MKVGIFGGSFDPVHSEHINMAQAAIKGLSLDRLIIVPVYTAPHKAVKVAAASAEDRLKMLSLAFSGIEKTEVSDYEISKGGTSYTYLTCEHFSELYSGDELFFLVGKDMLEDFFTWRNPDEILSLVTLAACGRDGVLGDVEDIEKKFFSRFKKSFRYVSYDGADVSSTEARVRVAVGFPLNGLVPHSVESYIKEKGLYKIPFSEEALSLEKDKRAMHSRRVAYLAGKLAKKYGIAEYKALTAGLFHDVAKNLPSSSPYLKGFVPPDKVPSPVLHQYTGAYVAEHTFGIKDEDILNAIKYHTSGRAGMSALEKLIFLSDMLESERVFTGVEELRKKLNVSLDECMEAALYHQIKYLEDSGSEIYPLTLSAYQSLKEDNKK